ncbi:MAG: septum formation inhibitor Maf [Candidatus Krumholzibacteriota bacterium]|nr:septum formation inhibitor Maf [Candidatus Krumholzibacteriota bacterium]
MNPFLSLEVQSRLVLASASPRRREILEGLGFEFEILPAQVEEDEIFWNDPREGVRLLAELKAVDVQRSRPRKTIIAADTIVVCENERLGKPDGPEEAEEMLSLLSGRRHQVITGVILAAPPNKRIVGVESTNVFFRQLEGREIARYIDTGEPYDKAGAYAIQGYASVFIDRIEGCYFNVVGLPVPRLFRMFRELEKG